MDTLLAAVDFTSLTTAVTNAWVALIGLAGLAAAGTAMVRLFKRAGRAV